MLGDRRNITKKERKMSSKYLTIEQAATLLNLKPSRLRYEILRKRIPHFKIGRSIRFEEPALITWVETNKVLANRK